MSSIPTKLPLILEDEEENEDELEEDDEEDILQMSPGLLDQVIGEESASKGHNKINFDDKHFINELFKIEFLQMKPNFSLYMELKLCPPMD